MKIFYIANTRIPTEKAHGIQIMKMCEVFALNNTIELIVPRRANWIKEDPFDYYGVNKVFTIKKLPCLDLIPLDKHIGHLGLWVESSTFSFSVFLYLLFKKADIIYTRDKLLFLFSFAIKNMVFEAHTFPKRYFLYSLFLKKIKRIVVITEKLKETFVRNGIVVNKVLVAPDGVDLVKFDINESQEECRKKLNFPQDKKIVLYSGHFYKWKGVDVLLNAAEKLPNILFIFIGGTKEDIKIFRQKARVFDNVMIVGHKPYKEMPGWLKSADVLILPNSGKAEISKHWTSPMKLFEYMAARKPIIASDLPSIREVLNKENAVLVGSDNPEELAQGIKKVLQSPQLSDKISAKAFQDVQQYTWQKRADKILDFLNQ